MTDPIASNPFHIARAYQLAAPRAAAGFKASPAKVFAGAELQLGGLSRLVAGTVPGRIDFAGEQPAQVAGALAMYRHPADRNTAATAVQAGRLLDTTA